MNRIALLLAAVGLGSGCVVSTPCDAGSLTVDWSFIDAYGATTSSCSTAGVLISDIHVWVDGVQSVAAVCSGPAVTISGIPAGGHTVIVEGLSGSTIINRAQVSASVACGGNTPVAAQLGEGYLDIKPTNCRYSSGTYLPFSITDVSTSATRVISQPPGSTLSFTCSGGISARLPYGAYDLTGLEETGSSGSPIYSTLCPVHPVAVDLTAWNQSPYGVTFDNVASRCW